MQHSYLADIDSVVFGLQKLWYVSREMVSVLELLTTGFVQPLENKIDMIQKVNINETYLTLIMDIHQ